MFHIVIAKVKQINKQMKFTGWVRINTVKEIITLDNSPYRLIFVLDKSRPKKLNSRKEPFKSSKIPKFG